MIFFNVKSFFLEKVYDIIIFLCIIHVVTLIIGYLIKWFHPNLKAGSEMCCNKNISGQYKTISRLSKRFKNKRERFNEDTDTGSMSLEQMSGTFKAGLIIAREYESKNLENMGENGNKRTDTESLFEKAQSDIGPNNSQSSSCVCPPSKSEKPHTSLVGINNFTQISAITGPRVIKNQECSVQTNVTISPRLRIEYSRPSQNLVFTCVPVKSSILQILENSSDSLESASSDCSTDVEKVSINHNLKCCEILNKKKHHLDSIVERVKPKELVNKVSSRNNKLLEMAICKFEKELMPIKYQIKELKEFFYDVKGSNLNVSSTSVNNRSFLSSRSESRSECLSLTTSTTCSVFPNTCSSSALASQITVSSLQPESPPDKNPQNLAFDALNLSNETHVRNPKTKQSGHAKKHSPLAEMYIQLSQSDSLSPISITHTTRQKDENGKKPGLTYEINLNVNVGRTVVSTHLAEQLQGCDIMPVLSQPEDFLYGQLHTHL